MPTNNMNPNMRPTNRMPYGPTGAAMPQAVPYAQPNANWRPNPQQANPTGSADYTVRLSPAHREITIKMILD